MKRKIIVTTEEKLAKRVLKHSIKNKDKNIGSFTNLPPKVRNNFNTEYSYRLMKALEQNPELEQQKGKNVVFLSTLDRKPSNSSVMKLKEHNIEEILVVGNIVNLEEYTRLADILEIDLVAITDSRGFEEFLQADRLFNPLETLNYDVKIPKDIQENLEIMNQYVKPVNEKQMDIAKRLHSFLTSNSNVIVEKSTELPILKHPTHIVPLKTYGEGVYPASDIASLSTPKATFEEFIRAKKNSIRILKLTDEQLTNILNNILSHLNERHNSFESLSDYNKHNIKDILQLAKQWLDYKNS